MPDHRLELREVRKTFESPQGLIHAVDGVDLQISGDEFFTMLGPSGCGKTTTLRMIAGLESISAGQIIFDGEDFSRIPSAERGIGMVFQSYALFPHLTVFENAAYGMRIRRMPTSVIREQVGAVLSMLGLAKLASRYPADLSGGQQQRVSIARALVYNPRLLLLDEPLANLDAKLRVEMREEIRRLQKQLGVMTIFVTHDQEEALSVSDRLAVFSQGKITQIGSGTEIYQAPRSLFVADFIGKANFFPAHLSNRNGSGAVATLVGGPRLEFASHCVLAPEESASLPAGQDCVVMVRPEQLALAPSGVGEIACTIKRIQFLGGFVRYVLVTVDAQRDIIVDSWSPPAGLSEGNAASLSIRMPNAHLFLRGAAA